MRTERQGLEVWGLRLRIGTILSIFTHSNTADRTYNLPDKSGTVALLSDIVGGANSGIATVDFGSGKDLAFVTITAQSTITATSKVFAQIRAESTLNNSIDSVLAEGLVVFPGNIVPGTSFTIYVKPLQGLAYGQYNVSWFWL